MNMIIVAGHPCSGFRDVNTLLNHCGVSPANVSHGEGVSATEIGVMLCKAHGVGSLDSLAADQQINQIDVGAVWNGMALDLMRGNLEQPLWGWADSQIVYFLDYWKKLDPKFTFVLVYNHPRSVLSQDPHLAADLSTEDLNKRIHQWQTYNNALLNFYYKNKDRCLLVHSHQVKTSVSNYLEQLRDQVGLIAGGNAEQLIYCPDDDTLSLVDSGHNKGNHHLAIDDQKWLQTFSGGRENPLKQFLAEQLVDRFPAAFQLYEEMQAVASLHCDDDISGKGALSAWNIMADIYQQSRRLGDQSLERQQYIELLEQQRKKLLAGSEEISMQKSLLSQQLQQVEQQTDASIKEIKEENELLLLQLHQVQEDLEQHYLDSQEKNKKIEEYEAAQRDHLEYRKKAEELQNQLDVLTNKIKQKEGQLEKALQQSQGIKEIEDLKEENELLLLQLHQVQEELERYYLENRELKSHQKPAYYGAAERLKGELPYVIGGAIIERSRKVWPLPFLPFSMWRVARQQRNAQQSQGGDLPPLTEYRDYHEAEKACKHLSYRLGMVWLKHIRTPWGWLMMPFALIGTHLAYRKERREKGKS